MNRCIIFFAAALVAAPLCAQHLAFKNYTRSNGIASDYVLCIFQDRDGFMWFGTDRGVSRYDGQSFVTYTTNNGLKSNFINTICQDNSGALWFGTYDGGATRFDGRTFKTFTTDDGLPSNEVGVIVRDGYGRIYFRTTRGLAFVAKDSTVRVLDPSVRSVVGPLSNGSFIVTDSSRIRRLSPSAKDSFSLVELHVRGDRSLLTTGVLPQPEVVTRAIPFGLQVSLALFALPSILMVQFPFVLHRSAHISMQLLRIEIMTFGSPRKEKVSARNPAAQSRCTRSVTVSHACG